MNETRYSLRPPWSRAMFTPIAVSWAAISALVALMMPSREQELLEKKLAELHKKGINAQMFEHMPARTRVHNT